MTRFSVVAIVAVAASFAAAAPAPVILHDRLHNRHAHIANARQNWGDWSAGSRTRTRCPTVRTSTQTIPASTATFTDAPVSTSSEIIAYPEPTSEAPEPTSSILPATSTIVPTTTQAASATAAAVPSSKPSEGSSGNAEIDAYLKGHNDIRAQHDASSLTWATDLAAAAAKWAENCVWEHSQGQVGEFGENLAAGTSLGAAAAVKMWTDEASEYDPANPQYSHFTQVVWKATTEVGCAVRTCNNLFSGNSGAVNFHVCEYRAPGNVIGQFAKNVQA
ncbi:unnamed protein product [Rhizoctonia solani]|uniref:SCP domain-containing protein n=1 Tax=Rhizoctonia solani TaxID=456999 RepID=A0A8H3B4P8_9AGAM|nr:unnamed protein product [Rhizoctonia solani]CAE6451845.1 unnamed protein product [Rhizoctonia solani]